MASVWLHPLGMSQLRNSPGISTGFLRHGRPRILTNKAIAYGSGRGDVLTALNMDDRRVWLSRRLPAADADALWKFR
jgi:hypothetical protein